MRREVLLEVPRAAALGIAQPRHHLRAAARSALAVALTAGGPGRRRARPGRACSARRRARPGSARGRRRTGSRARSRCRARAAMAHQLAAARRARARSRARARARSSALASRLASAAQRLAGVARRRRAMAWRLRADEAGQAPERGATAAPDLAEAEPGCEAGRAAAGDRADSRAAGSPAARPGPRS